MKTLLHLFQKFEIWLLALLKPLGVWGLVCMTAIDAAAVPLPIDLIIAGYIWGDKKHFYLYVIAASAGSAIGGLVPYLIGRAGGELFLLKRIDRARFEKLRDRFEKQEFLAIMIPSMLPPPAPWKLFAFGAGVFEMKLTNFMLAVFTGRILRDLVTACLVIFYGPQIVGIAGDLIKRHSAALLAGFAVLVALGVIWFLRKKKRV